MEIDGATVTTDYGDSGVVAPAGRAAAAAARAAAMTVDGTATRGGHSPRGVVACRGRDLRMQRTHKETEEKAPSRPQIDEPTPENHVSHTFQTH